jgi:hypothetical protein
MGVQPARRQQIEKQRMQVQETRNFPQRLGEAHLEREVAKEHVPVVFRQLGRRLLH